MLRAWWWCDWRDLRLSIKCVALGLPTVGDSVLPRWFFRCLLIKCNLKWNQSEFGKGWTIQISNLSEMVIIVKNSTAEITCPCFVFLLLNFLMYYITTVCGCVCVCAYICLFIFLFFVSHNNGLNINFVWLFGFLINLRCALFKP